MTRYLQIIKDSYTGYWNYLKNEILYPDIHNYFYWLIGLSLLVWLLEIVFPWRREQSLIRRDFWLDGFYMFFNFFLFSLVLYNGLSNVAVTVFNDLLHGIGVENLIAIQIKSWPIVLQLLLMFVLADFIQWNVHRMLHRIEWMWQFHKLHHSVKQMGFAAHLRFHWMETVIYKSIQYIPLAMIGFGIADFFIVHIIAVAIGHLNHANLGWNYGPFRYLFNNPRMHIWHHARHLPQDRKYGANFGLSLSIWHYIFGTVYMPHSGRDIEIGFDGDQSFPQDFSHQILYPVTKSDKTGQDNPTTS